MKLGCPVCGSKFTIAEARHEAAMKEMIELAAYFGKNWGLVFDYTEGFRREYWGSVREQKRLRLLKEIRTLFDRCEFEIEGKRYRTDGPRIISAIGAVVDADKIGFKNHNYLKRVLLGEKAERVSAEGLTAAEEEHRETKRREHGAESEEPGMTAKEFKDSHAIESLVDGIGNKKPRRSGA